MTDAKPTEIRREGDPAFEVDTENDNSASSSEGEQTENENNGTENEGDKKPKEENTEVPFNEHPRWKERETEWDERFNSQETRHQEDLRKLREEFGGARKENAENTAIPSWFGGTQRQWDSYRADRDKELEAMETRAIDKAYERISGEKTAQDKAVEEATTFMRSEMTAIEQDKTLNPTGEKIDPNKLLRIVMDNELIDSKGRWNYRAGYKLYQASKPASAKPNADRKNIAGATTSEPNKGEPQSRTYKTADDFKKDRPW